MARGESEYRYKRRQRRIVVPGGGTSKVNVRWGELMQASDQDDSLLRVDMYGAANIEEFVVANCGAAGSGGGSGSGSGSAQSNSFLDMDFTFCSPVGTTLALVPAGYKPGPVGIIKMPLCPPEGSGSGSGSCSGSGSGSGSAPEFEGWVVVFGRRQRCTVRIPVKIECCPIGGLKFTKWREIWYFGAELPEIDDPCPAE